MTPFFEAANASRVILYLAIALIFSFLAYAYHFGYRHLRTTPIIRALNRLFFTLAALFFYYSFLPVLKVTAPAAYSWATDLLVIFLVPVLVTAWKFWDESFRQQKPGKGGKL